MASSYDLALAGRVPPGDVVRRIQEFVGGDLRSDTRLVVLSGLVVNVSSVEDALSQEVYLDAWGMEMGTSIGFAVGYPTEPEMRYQAAELMSMASVRLAAELDTDAGLIHQFERRLMRRRNGVLFLYDWWPQWSEPGVQERLPRPFEFTDEESRLD